MQLPAAKGGLGGKFLRNMELLFSCYSAAEQLKQVQYDLWATKQRKYLSTVEMRKKPLILSGETGKTGVNTINENILISI